MLQFGLELTIYKVMDGHDNNELDYFFLIGYASFFQRF
jgi:hypothetical protein